MCCKFYYENELKSVRLVFSYPRHNTFVVRNPPNDQLKGSQLVGSLLLMILLLTHLLLLDLQRYLPVITSKDISGFQIWIV